MDEDEDANVEDKREDAEESEEDGEPSSKKGGRKKLLLIVGLASLVVLGGAAAAYFTGLLDPLIAMVAGGGSGEGKNEVQAVKEPVFYDLPELLVNLNTGGRKSTFLKIRVGLELEKAEDIP